MHADFLWYNNCMEKHFLPQKYPDLAGSKPVERAVDKSIRENKKIPKEEREKSPENNQERVDVFLGRLERIVDDEHGYRLLKERILDRFTLNVENPETLEKIAEGLYESEKKIAIEQGRGADIQKLGSIREVVEKYKPLVMEKAEIQRETLSSWLDYLKQNDSKHPMWFRYFVMRSIEKMGILSKETLEYSKRAKTTVAPFPELNSEALGWVFKRLDEGIDSDEFRLQDLGEEMTPEAIERLKQQQEKLDQKQATLKKLLNAKDFAKLYAFALVETAGKAMELNGEKIEGEWRKYEQGSDYHVLENDLKNKGTGWCTATGSAQQHLQGGDFWVYYLKGENGAYTEPRVAIRMDGDKVGEVRGVNHRQELEPELVDIAQEKYHTLPGGESYDKKAGDMKKVTELIKKQEKGEQFSKEDLVFLYEIDNVIEGFGYDKDPRIEQLRKSRNLEKDAAIVFECDPEEIIRNPNEVNENTKAYIGPWSVEIFQKIRNYPNIEHLYESFPDKKIFLQTIETNPNIDSPQRAQDILEKENDVYISDWGKDILQKTEFSKEGKKYDLVRFTVGQLGLSTGATTDQIYQRAEQLGLELCPAEVGPLLRLQSKAKEWTLIAMKQITDRIGHPDVFSLNSGGEQLKLNGDDAKPGKEWNDGIRFVFRFRKFENLET